MSETNQILEEMIETLLEHELGAKVVKHYQLPNGSWIRIEIKQVEKPADPWAEFEQAKEPQS